MLTMLYIVAECRFNEINTISAYPTLEAARKNVLKRYGWYTKNGHAPQEGNDEAIQEINEAEEGEPFRETLGVVSPGGDEINITIENIEAHIHPNFYRPF